ncbi:C3HC zinc finger-like-domain-containing protein [Lipomyces arxii]|uniref:C3HC zinc finger-like-domain-containing protein n=1 Tax=Lipomyces arxii TaxID=56418 RepID=UPI0034CFE0F8
MSPSVGVDETTSIPMSRQEKASHVLGLIDPFNVTPNNVPSPRSKRVRRIRSELQKKRQSMTSLSSSGEPVYAPWSRTQLLERLRSFRTCGWEYNHGIRVTCPLLWARCGWTANASDRVECNVCGRVCGYEDAILRYRVDENAPKVIRGSHAESCSWIRRVCDEGLYGMSLSLGLEDSVSVFKDRVRRLYENSVEVETNSELDANIISVSLAGMGLENNERSKAGFTLAIAGWDYSEDAGVECSQCFVTTQSKINSVSGHEDYCPWRHDWKLLYAIVRARVSTKSDNDDNDDYDDDDDTELTKDKDRKVRMEKIRSMYVYRRRV